MLRESDCVNLAVVCQRGVILVRAVREYRASAALGGHGHQQADNNEKKAS